MNIVHTYEVKDSIFSHQIRICLPSVTGYQINIFKCLLQILSKIGYKPQIKSNEYTFLSIDAFNLSKYYKWVLRRKAINKYEIEWFYEIYQRRVG